MKVISLNMHGYQEIDTLSNIKRLAKYIKNNHIDVILLQEVADILNYDNTNTAIILNSYLHDYDIYVEIFKTPDKVHGEGLAILSKYPLYDRRSNLISSTNDFNSWQKRKILSATVNVDGKEVFLCTTHLGWTTRSESFKTQALKLHSVIGAQKHSNIILGGDFNCPIFFYNFRYIKSMKLDNVFENLNMPTYIGNNGIPLSRRVRIIDYVFTQGFDTEKKGRRFVKHPISDHVLLYCQIENKKLMT